MWVSRSKSVVRKPARGFKFLPSARSFALSGGSAPTWSTWAEISFVVMTTVKRNPSNRVAANSVGRKWLELIPSRCLTRGRNELISTEGLCTAEKDLGGHPNAVENQAVVKM